MNASFQQNFELPRYDGPVDHLRYGFNSLENQFNASHPVAAIQKGDAESQFFRKLKTVRSMYGSGLAMRLATDRAVLSRKRRLHGLASSSVLLDTVTGDDTTISFEDVLNGKNLIGNYKFKIYS